MRQKKLPQDARLADATHELEVTSSHPISPRPDRVLRLLVPEKV